MQQFEAMDGTWVQSKNSQNVQHQGDGLCFLSTAGGRPGNGHTVAGADGGGSLTARITKIQQEEEGCRPQLHHHPGLDQSLRHFDKGDEDITCH